MDPVKKHTFLRFYLFLSNIVETFYHRQLNDESLLIKNTGLFNHISEQKYNLILKHLQTKTYPSNFLVLREGDVADGLYIIFSGSVRVFTINLQKQKIPLARLSAGDYFGEQALLGEANKTRNASIETMENTILIKIKSKYIFSILSDTRIVKTKLQKKGIDQAIHALSSTLNIYADIKPIINLFEKKSIKEFRKNEIIFHAGEEADNVYLILKGKVQLVFSGDDKSNLKTLIIHSGHLFGELGIIENKLRQATAIAYNNIRLLAIDGESFKKHHHENKRLQELMAVLKSTYQLPMRGTIEQYVSSNENIGSTITNILKMDDGRLIISVSSFNFFKMEVTNQAPTENYKHIINDQHFIELKTRYGYLVAIDACGSWEDLLPIVCRNLIDKDFIPENLLKTFAQSGELLLEDIDTEVICNCMSVTRKSLQNLIDSGISDIDTLSRKTGACTICQSCRPRILEMLGENPWVSATMETAINHNDKVRSYLIKPINSQFKKYLAGQHTIIQVKVKDNWIERNYTISNINELLRVTIKKETGGLFTEWLFNEAPEHFSINAMQPMGNFILKSDNDFPAICFAGGIGITPFIAYANELLTNTSTKRMHILYSVRTENDILFKADFDKISQFLSSITINYRITSKEGRLTEKDIMDTLSNFSNPDIYICGPQSFVKLITEILSKIKFNQSKIHTEIFLHAGGPR